MLVLFHVKLLCWCERWDVAHLSLLGLEWDATFKVMKLGDRSSLGVSRGHGAASALPILHPVLAADFGQAGEVLLGPILGGIDLGSHDEVSVVFADDGGNVAARTIPNDSTHDRTPMLDVKKRSIPKYNGRTHRRNEETCITFTICADEE